jgi:hypothetical protein
MYFMVINGAIPRDGMIVLQLVDCGHPIWTRRQKNSRQFAKAIFEETSFRLRPSQRQRALVP